MKFNGTTWRTVGNAGFSEIGADLFFMAISPAGKPFVIYADNQHDYKLQVMMFNGIEWETVSTLGLPEGDGGNPTIAIDRNDSLYLSYSSVMNNDKANVYKFNGSKWKVVGNANFSNYVAEGLKIAFDPNDTPYVVYEDYTSNEVATVKRFNGVQWETLGKLDQKQPGSIGGEPYFPNIAFDRYDTAYVAYRGAVKKFNGVQWETVGNPDFNAGQDSHPIICIDGKGTIYLVYHDGSLSALKIEGENVNSITTEFPIVQPTVKALLNPFTDKLIIGYTSPINTIAKLEIFDANASKLAELFDSHISGGMLYQAEYLPQGTNSQLLFYRLTMGGQSYVGKLIYQGKR